MKCCMILQNKKKIFQKIISSGPFSTISKFRLERASNISLLLSQLWYNLFYEAVSMDR